MCDKFSKTIGIQFVFPSLIVFKTQNMLSAKYQKKAIASFAKVDLILILMLAFGVMSTKGSSQVQFGFKAGLSSLDLVSNAIQIDQGSTNLKLSFENSTYGHHFGFYTRLSFLGIYLEPNFQFHSNVVQYRLKDYSRIDEAVSTIFTESYQNFDIPVLLGIKAGPLRFFAGPVAHLHISSTGDLVDFPGYNQRFKSATYGYLAGLGLDLWRLRLELAYEGNLSRFGSHFVINDQPYQFSEAASRIIASIGFRF